MITEYQAAMRKASSDTTAMTKNVSGSIASLNREVGALGTELTRKVTVPLVGIGVGALKLAGDFETAFAQMVGLAGVAGEEVDGLRESVLKLAHETAQSPQQLAEALYFVRSSGIDAADAMDVVEVSAKAAAAGLGQTSVIADAVTSAMNAYGAENLTASRATDILVAAVREGKAEAAALAPVMGVLIPTAAAMGVSFDKVAGTLAVMSRTGLDAAEASTSLNAVFSTLLGTSEQGTKLLEDHGLSLKQLRDVAAGPQGVVGVMRLLDAAFKDNDEALSTIIPNVRAFRGFMNVLAQDADSVDQVMRNVANSVGATDDAFQKVKGTDAFKLKQAWVDLQATLIRLGAILAPIAAEVGNAIGGILRGFQALPPELQQVIVVLGLMAAATGPVLKGISMVTTVVVPAIRALQTFRLQLALARMQGLTTGQAMFQMASGITGAQVAAAGATLLITGLALAIRDSEEAARRAAERQKALANAIKDTGSVAGGVAGLINNLLQNSQQFSSAFAQAGVSVGEVSAALEAGGSTWTAMRDRILAGARAAGLTGLSFEGLRTVLDDLPNDAARAQQHLANLEATGASTADATDGLTDATMEAANAQLDAAIASASHAGGLAGVSAAAAAAEAELRAFLSTLSAVYESSFLVADAQADWSDALSDVDNAARVSGGSTRDLTSEQRSLERATKDVTKAQQSLADAEAALAEARRGPSAREKSDAALDVREAQLAVKEATKAQADARKRLADERKKGRDGDVAGAQLEVESAAIRLKRAQDRLTDAQADQNKVMNSGKDTSEEVKKALDDVEQAQDRLTEATERQSDAERQLRSEAGGGPVADRAKNIARSYDTLVDKGKALILSMVEMKKPTDEIIGALDNQNIAAKNLIDTYGDPEGKLQRFIDNNDKLKRIFADAKFQEDAKKIAQAVGVIVSQSGVIIDMGGAGDAGGGFAARAKGGPVRPGETVVVGEDGPELFTAGSAGGFVSDNSMYRSVMTKASPYGEFASSAMASPAPWSGALSSTPVVAQPVIELTVVNNVEGDIAKVINEISRRSQRDPVNFRVKSGR